jgi:hypothetical protein
MMNPIPVKVGWLRRRVENVKLESKFSLLPPPYFGTTISHNPLGGMLGLCLTADDAGSADFLLDDAASSYFLVC